MRGEILQKVESIIFGHAVGDAVGGPFQFADREERNRFPATDMISFGDSRFPKGTWSDDTSMSLCAIEALIEHGLKLDKVMENFRKWLYENEFTPTGVTFDVGNACYQSIERSLSEFAEGCGCCDEYKNGNGSLMRIYPFSLYLYYSGFTIEGKLSFIYRASALTHAHPRSCIGCGIYSFVIWELLENPTKQGIRDGLKKAERFYHGDPEFKKYHRLFEEIEKLPREKIKSGGYVVDTLEAAIWCVFTTENYRDCVLKAVNLGMDTDSVGAVTGSFAGLIYGYDGIPEDWRKSLCKKKYLKRIGQVFCNKLCSLFNPNEWQLLKYKSQMIQISEFFFICENNQTDGCTVRIICPGNTPPYWRNAEDCLNEYIDKKIVIFQYQRKVMSDSAINGLAFTNQYNYKKFFDSIPIRNSCMGQAIVPFWNYTAFYKLPNFHNFRDAREYLVSRFNLKAENVMEWNNNEERNYELGFIQW